jgi:hypothetical protein
VCIGQSGCETLWFQPDSRWTGLLALSQRVDYTTACGLSTPNATTCSGSGVGCVTVATVGRGATLAGMTTRSP